MLTLFVDLQIGTFVGPNLGPKNVKKLELPHKPRVIKKAKRQKKHTSIRNEDQLPITNFLRGVPTPDDFSSKQQGKCRVSCVACRVSRVVCRVSCVVCRVSCVACRVSCVACRVSCVVCVCVCV